MYGYQGAGSRKEVVLLIVFLLIGACAAGVMIADSYWGNPPREQVEAEEKHIQNSDLEERLQIDREAYRQQKNNETQALKERAQRALLWQDRWNELGMVLVTATVAGLLVIVGIRVAVPVTVQAYERYADRRAQLVEQETGLAEKRIAQEARRAERLREERRLEEIRLQQIHVALAQGQPGGNGREREVSSEQSTMTSSRNTGTSSTQRDN